MAYPLIRPLPQLDLDDVAGAKAKRAFDAHAVDAVVDQAGVTAEGQSRVGQAGSHLRVPGSNFSSLVRPDTLPTRTAYCCCLTDRR